LIHVKTEQGHWMQSDDTKMEGIMPFETVAYLAFVVAALGVFGAALTYAEWATRQADDAARKRTQVRKVEPTHRGDTDAVRKAA
jgi:hypothetical protein